MLTRLKSGVARNILNIPGWRTKKRIVVFESDDWGSIRIPSIEVYKKFLSRGFDLSGSDYNRLDMLESNEDLEMLFGVLNTFRGSDGNPPVFTANCVVGNPDFKKIKQSEFTRYYYEPVNETLKRYPNRDQVVLLWKQGDNKGIFHPQFHGREHVNIVRWMDALKKRTPEIMFTFDNETTFSGEGDYNFMEVLDYNSPDDLAVMNESLAEGLDDFEQLFGYRSKSFIPPCYTWNTEVEKVLYAGGVRYIQGLAIQSVPTGTYGNYKKKYHYLGQKNSMDQLYLIRNCFFEPSLTKLADPVDDCLRRIKTAFYWNKPAIISTHRINYIGGLEERNRADNLNLLGTLIKQILSHWPEVVFVASDKLGDLVAGNSKAS
ncbi:MAG: hypothetical protein JXB00_08675 [Bacteroidales bacterium]|nr:hypothetical protein [Bacteroidales bacterium]